MTSDDSNGAALRAVRGGVLETMTMDECRACLAQGEVGRFLFAADRGPVSIPVNYKMLDNDIVFRTDDCTAAAGAISQQRVSFDVDRFDESRREGWSVLVSGSAIIVTLPEDVRAAEELAIEPWARGDRDTYIRIVPDEVTGRRIRSAPAVGQPRSAGCDL